MEGGWERGRETEPALKTKDELVVRGVGKTGEARPGGSGGHAAGLLGKGQGFTERTE